MVNILIICRIRVDQVIIVTLTIQGYCAIVIISIATSRHGEVFETTGKLLGWRRQNDDAAHTTWTERGRDV